MMKHGHKGRFAAYIAAAVSVGLLSIALASPAIADTVSGTTLATGTGPYSVAYSPDGTKAYVLNKAAGTLSVINNIDPSTGIGTVSGTPITVAAANSPLTVVYSPDGSELLVTDSTGQTVKVISTQTNQVIQTISTPGVTAYGIAFAPDGSKAYVTGFGTSSVSILTFANGVGTLSGTTISVGANPSAVVVSPDGTRAFVTNYGSNTISVINTQTNVATTLSSSNFSGPLSITLSPDGTKAYVSNYTNSTVAILAVSGGAATVTGVISTGLGVQPAMLAFNSDGSKAYVPNAGSNTVSVLNTATNTVIATLSVGAHPTSVAFSPDATHAFVTNRDANTVSVISVDVVPSFSGAPPSGVVGTAYSTSFVAYGRPTFSITAGALPAGVTLNTTTGAITGTPSVAGSSTFTLTATNGTGSAAHQYTIVISAPPAPGAPTNVVGSAGISSTTVSWSAPSPSTGVTGYTVTASPGGATCSTASAAGTSCIIGGVAGTAYTYTVVAHSASGDSVASAASIPATPSAPVTPTTLPTTAPATLATTGGALTTAEPGQSITVTGSGFLPNSTVNVALYASVAGSTPTSLARATANSTGTVTAQVVLPSSLAAATYNLVAVGVDPTGAQHVIRLAFTVSGSLATTGVDSLSLVAISLVLLLAGFSIIVTRRATRLVLR